MDVDVLARLLRRPFSRDAGLAFVGRDDHDLQGWASRSWQVQSTPVIRSNTPSCTYWHF